MRTLRMCGRRPCVKRIEVEVTRYGAKGPLYRVKYAGLQKHRAEWEAISTEYRMANTKGYEISKAASGRLTHTVEAVEAVADAVQCQLDECARRLWKEPVLSIEDASLRSNTVLLINQKSIRFREF